MLLLAPVLILWTQISREFGVSLIAPKKFSTAESYLQATVGVGFSDWEQDVEKNIKTKMWEIEGVGEGDMERRRKYTRRMKETIIAERINIWSDFLCYFSLLFWTEMNGQQIKHFPEFLLLQEGENFTTYCNSSSFLSSSQWYKQRSGSSPVLLMILAKGGEVKTEQRLTGQLGETKQHSSLHLTAAQLSDAGTYFCTGHSALEAPAVCPQTSLWAPAVAPPHLSSEQGPEIAEFMMSMKKLKF